MDKIVFEYNGVIYSMTEEEIEAAFDYRRQQNLLEDAERQLEMYAFGITLDCVDEERKKAELVDFRDRHGIPYEVVRDNRDRIVERFEKLRREDIDDDMTWAVAIEAVISDLALHHPTCYEQLEELYRENPAYLFIIALFAVLQNGMDWLNENTMTDIFSVYSFTEPQKTAALRIAFLMKHTEPDVLMAFVQRVMLPFQDCRGERIPFLHPYGDEETVCPVCGRPVIKPKIAELMTTDDGGIAEWRCVHCGAKGCAKYLLAFERHIMVEDGTGNHVPNRKWDF